MHLYTFLGDVYTFIIKPVDTILTTLSLCHTALKKGCPSNWDSHQKVPVGWMGTQKRGQYGGVVRA